MYLVYPRPPSTGSTEPKALFSIVLLDIYCTYNWYISVLPKIDKLTFIAAPPFCPVPCNHSWIGFKLGRTNATHLWRMSWVPPHNVVHWRHLFKMPIYTKVKLLWWGYIKTGHHALSLVWVGAMHGELFWEITEIQNKKYPQHDLCAAPNCHLGGGIYNDSAYPIHCMKFSPKMVFQPFHVCKLAILLFLVNIPWENPDSWC